MKRKAGFVAIIGKPNVGKSTLLNRLVGGKLAGVSAKPQTTRGTIRGILTRSEGQIVFVDTPGLHEPRDLLGSWMVHKAQKASAEVDAVCWMVLPERMDDGDRKILEMVRPPAVPVLLLINQVDRYPKPHVLPVLDEYQKQFSFREIIPLSARTGEQVDLLIKKLFECLPEGHPLFPADQLSDQNERSLAEEIIREKLFHFTGEEIPYATAVVIEEFKERDERLAEIQATVVVEKDSQKAIVIGKGGNKLKEIGTAARKDIEQLIGRKVFLKLWVKTMKNWKKDKNAMEKLGYGREK